MTNQSSTLVEHHSIVIIGTGFGGISAAIQLIKQQRSDFIMLERRDFIGGTWAQNSYPGAAVDVQSPLYSLADEPFPWSEMFAPQTELKAYTQGVFDKYALADKARTGSNVTKLVWDDNLFQWQIFVNEELCYTAKFVINATGPLSSPVIPPFQGKDSFTGESFHTNQWDHTVDYGNKNVAIIGSGASAAQVIPAIASDVKHLHVFQRSAHWVLPRADKVFSTWQRNLLKSKWVYKSVRGAIYWLLELRVLGFKYSDKVLHLLGTIPARKMLRKQIPDPALRAKLTPDYTIGCKRILVSNTLFPALMQDNVTLHAKEEGIARILPNGIETLSGKSIDLDIIVYATGFDATDGLISYPVFGREGKNLRQCWEDFPQAYLGTAMHGFPNFFVITGPNTGIGHTSALLGIESQLLYVMQCLKKVEEKDAQYIEVKQDAEREYTSMVLREMTKTVWHYGGCNSWYKSASGKVIAMFPGFSFSFRRLCKRFKSAHHVIE